MAITSRFQYHPIFRSRSQPVHRQNAAATREPAPLAIRRVFCGGRETRATIGDLGVESLQIHHSAMHRSVGKSLSSGLALTPYMLGT